MDQRLSLFLRPRNGASMFTPFSQIAPVVRRPESPQEITHFEKPVEELAELLMSQGAKAKYLQEKLCDGFFRVRCKIEKLNVIEDVFADTAENAMDKVASSLLRLFKNLFLQANTSHDSPDIYESTFYLMKNVPSNRGRPIFLPENDAKSCFNLLRQNTNDFLGQLVGFDIDDFQRSGGSHNPMFYLHGTLQFRTSVKHQGFRKKINVFITEGAIGGNKKTTMSRAHARMLNKMVRLMKNLELENFDPTPEDDPTLEVGMSEIKPALPASDELDEEDEPKLTKKQWEALLNEKSQKSEKQKKIEESLATPVVEPAMTEIAESAIYSDIIEEDSSNFSSISDEFEKDKPAEKDKPVEKEEAKIVKTVDKSDREKALEDKIDRLENLVLKLLEDKTSSKKKSRKKKQETSSSEASSEDSDL